MVKTKETSTKSAPPKKFDNDKKPSSAIRVVDPKQKYVRGKDDKARPAGKILLPNNDPNLSNSQNRRRFELEKKMKRKSSFDTIKTINKLYSQLLIAGRDAPKGNFKKVGRCTPTTVQICAEIIKVVKDNIVNHANHRSISRAIQTVISFGDEKQRNFVMEALTPNFANLAMLNHGSRLCQKLLACSDRKDVDRYLNQLTVDFKTANETFFHTYGIAVWDKLADIDIRQSTLRKMLYKVFLCKTIWVQHSALTDLAFPQLMAKLPEDVKKDQLAYMGKLLDRLFDKNLYNSSCGHLLMRDYMLYADETMINDLLGKLEDGEHAHAGLMSTREGGEVLAKLLGFASAKHKKKFAKAVKEAVGDVACNRHVQIVLTRLMTTMDDTKLLKDSTTGEIARDSELVERLALDKTGVRALLVALNPKNLRRYVTAQDKELLELPAPASKKDMEKRRDEIVEPLVRALGQLFTEQEEEMDIEDAGIEEDNFEDEEEQQEDEQEEEDEAMEQEDAASSKSGSDSDSSSDEESEDEEDDDDRAARELDDEDEEDEETTAKAGKPAAPEPAARPDSALAWALHESASPLLFEFLLLAPEATRVEITTSLIQHFAAAVKAIVSGETTEELTAVVESQSLKQFLTRLIQEAAAENSPLAAFPSELLEGLKAAEVAPADLLKVGRFTFLLVDLVKALPKDAQQALKKELSKKTIEKAKAAQANEREHKAYDLLVAALGF